MKWLADTLNVPSLTSMISTATEQANGSIVENPRGKYIELANPSNCKEDLKNIVQRWGKYIEPIVLNENSEAAKINR